MVTMSRQCCQVLFVLSVSVSLSLYLSLSISLSLSLSLCPCLPPLSSVLCSSQRKLVYITGISSRGQVIHSLPLHSQSQASLCPSIFFLLLSSPPYPYPPIHVIYLSLWRSIFSFLRISTMIAYIFLWVLSKLFLLLLFSFFQPLYLLCLFISFKYSGHFRW